MMNLKTLEEICKWLSNQPGHVAKEYSLILAKMILRETNQRDECND